MNSNKLFLWSFPIALLLLVGWVQSASCDSYEYGYIDKTGNVIVSNLWIDSLRDLFNKGGHDNPEFDYHNSRVMLRKTDGIYFADPSGKIVLGPYRQSTHFASGMASVIDIEGNTKFINVNGVALAQMKLSKNVSINGVFSDGLIRASVFYERERKTYYGFMNAKGDWAINPQFFNAKDFSDGLAAASILVPNENPEEQPIEIWGFIDKSGKFAIKPQYHWAYSFSQGLARVNTMTGSIYINKLGQQIASGLSQAVINDGLFRDGIALVDNRAYIGKTGKEVIHLDSNYFGSPFSEGLAKAEYSDKGLRKSHSIGFIDTTGKWVIPSHKEWDGARAFSDGLAAASVRPASGELRGIRWGYIDKSGKWVIQPQFKEVRSFHEGRAAVQLAGWRER